MSQIFRGYVFLNTSALFPLIVVQSVEYVQKIILVFSSLPARR